jgi:hypothetical protein
MELSKLSNKELKNILRENQVKNYSKLNKKELVKKVNQLIKAQNGGKSGKKKYKLKELIGGKDPEELEQPLLSKENRKGINNPNSNSGKSRGYQPPFPTNIPITNNEKKRAASLQQQQPSANLLNQSENNKLGQQTAQLINNNNPRTIQNQGTLVSSQSIQNPDNPQNKCDPCTIQ